MPVAVARSQCLRSPAHRVRAIETRTRGRSAGYARAACSTTARFPIVTLRRPRHDVTLERRRALQTGNLESKRPYGNLGDGILTKSCTAPAVRRTTLGHGGGPTSA